MYGRRMNNDNRVNEQHVPESQHTIFIRGLPGDMSTNVVKEFFEEHIGPCSFDFIKVSQDRTKLFVAVRFESKSEARKALDDYRDGEILGHPVEITFFRDIRRYLSHVQKQGGRGYNSNLNNNNNSNNNNRIEYRNGNRMRVPYRPNRSSPRRRSRSRSARSRSVSRSRSRSPSHSRSRSLTKSKSRSVSRSPSRSTQRSSIHSGRVSKTNGADEPRAETRQSLSPPPPPVKKVKKAKKEKKKKSKKHSPSPVPKSNHSSDMETGSDGETAPVKEEIIPIRRSNETSTKKGPSTPAAKSSGSVNNSPAATLVSPTPPMVIGPVQPKMQPSVILRNSCITVDLDSNRVPQQKVRRSPIELKSPTPNVHQSNQNGSISIKGTFMSIAQQEDARENGNARRFRDEDVVSSSLSMAQNQRNVKDELDQKLEQGEFGGAMTNFSIIQRRILQDVRYKIESSEEDHVGNFRLSSLSTHKTDSAIREEKIKKMTPEMRDKIDRKKMNLELNYRRDCETFGLMTRKLIAKDRLLEDRLRLALLEVMKDLEGEAMKQLDEYLDQILFVL